MIYIHFDKMPEILCDFWPKFEGVYTAVEQDNGVDAKRAMNELEAIDTAREIGKWFKTDSVFDVYRTGQQINKPILEVVL